MKLLGVELRNYARFTRCFVPLEPGVRLLVGKNNSGKSALLRALSTFVGLPFRDATSFPSDIARYAHQQHPVPSYEMDFVFAYEDEDRNRFGPDLGHLPPFRANRNRKWIYAFKVFPNVGRIHFVRAVLQSDSDQMPLLEREKGILLRLRRDTNGIVTGREQMGVAAHGPGVGDPEGTQIQTYEPDELFSGLTNLMRPRFVHAHRIVRPNFNLQALDTLPETADSLAPFLDTLHSNDRETFNKIEKVVIDVFPEFKFVNPEKSQNTVFITLTRRPDNQKIPLTHCGTGVEQILALATFILTSKPGTIFLLDEPHSYLHPIAERQLIDFLFAHDEHRYVIATHSAILINSVPPNKILVLGDSAEIPEPPSEPPSVPTLLHSLGYRNSDLLFHDRLVLVEGESDQEILPLLLRANALASLPDLEKTGFPVMNGEGKLRGKDQQSSLLYWEKFLSQLGRGSLPRIYLFDGDCVDDDRKLLEKTNVFARESPALLKFLPVSEIENYLLVPEAILSAIKDMAAILAVALPEFDEDKIQAEIDAILAKVDNETLYPNGVSKEPWRSVKGSVVLKMIFRLYELRYEKRRVGHLIATKINSTNQPKLKELWDIFPRAFLPTATASTIVD